MLETTGLSLKILYVKYRSTTVQVSEFVVVHYIKNKPLGERERNNGFLLGLTSKVFVNGFISQWFFLYLELSFA